MAGDFSQNISQQLRQTQRLTPMQMQLVRLLEMSGPEIDDEIQRQLDDNPALEVAEEQEHTDDDFTETAEQLQQADYACDDDVPFYPRQSSQSDDFRPELRDAGQTLHENLNEQISRSPLPEHIIRLAAYIIGNLDDNGYLNRPLRALETDLKVAGIKVDHDTMRHALDEVRKLDPAGVGAVDLRDCLLLQLKRMHPRPEQKDALAVATDVVADYFDLLGKKHYGRIMREMGIKDATRLSNAVKLIRTLNPKPGGTGATDGSSPGAVTIIPDFSVEIEDGRAIVSLLSNSPALQVEESFEREAASHPTNARERKASAFIRLKRDEAAAFIDVLRRRSQTMMTVMNAIVKNQWQFFLTGDVDALRPLVLRDIAAETGLDISVISRAAQGKYVTTPWGVFPLKMFFNERTSDTSDATSYSLLEAVRDVIENEDPTHPLSDQDICRALNQKGISMARRTVTKYRERLGLPPGRLRKKI